jgi:hypothetical protein
MGNADLPAPSIRTLTLDRAGILSLVTSNLPVTRTRRPRGSLSNRWYPSCQSVILPEPPTLSSALPLKRAADVVYTSSSARRGKLTSWISSQRKSLVGLVFAVKVALIADIIRMTASCRLSRENITRREQMPVIFGDHIAQLAPRLDERGIDTFLPTSSSQPLGHLPRHRVQLNGPRFLGIWVKKSGPGAWERDRTCPGNAVPGSHHLAELLALR